MHASPQNLAGSLQSAPRSLHADTADTMQLSAVEAGRRVKHATPTAHTAAAVDGVDWCTT